MSKVKLFLGEDFYPMGGYDDFHSYFETVEEAKEYVEENYHLDDCKWAHMVVNDKIILEGHIDTSYSIRKAEWEWRYKDE